MSVLETPRLAFRGQITWDPIVTNNYEKFYDETTSTTLYGPGETVARFRAGAIDAVTAGNWNPHGTHRSTFFETQVTSVDTGAGPTTDDPVVGAPVALTGMLVDLDPYGAFTSQLFFDAMTFGIDGGCQVVTPRQTRFADRQISFARNLGYRYVAGGAGVVWQTSFPRTAGLRIAAHHSPALAALARALEDDDVLGLTVRWSAYRTVYYDEPALGTTSGPVQKAVLDRVTGAHQARLRAGGFQPNPARSEVCGALGLWRRGEPAVVPGDRLLEPTSNSSLGVAAARLGGGRITLDLGNCVPEVDVDLGKQDLGPLDVVAIAGDGAVTKLATLAAAAYDRAAYDLGGGLVSPAVPTGVEITGDLAVQDAHGTVLLRERALQVCADQPNLYADAGVATTLSVRVLDRGAPPAGPMRVALADQTGASPPQLVDTDRSGVATFAIAAPVGGVTGYLLAAAPVGQEPTIPGGIDPSHTDFAYVRVLPADDDLAGMEPTWANVYQNVLMAWHGMAPCMDNWLALGDERSLRAAAAMVRSLTAADAFERFRYMPVTRDLSAGKRALLYAWLAATEAASPPAAPGPHAQSRALRRG